MTDLLLLYDPKTVGHRLKKQEVMPESLFARTPLAVRPLESDLGRWVFRSVGRLLKRRTRQRTAIVSTDLLMRHCSREAKRIKTTVLPVLGVPINAVTAILSRTRHSICCCSIVGQGGRPSVPKIVSVD